MWQLWAPTKIVDVDTLSCVSIPQADLIIQGSACQQGRAAGVKSDLQQTGVGKDMRCFTVEEMQFE